GKGRRGESGAGRWSGTSGVVLLQLTRALRSPGLMTLRIGSLGPEARSGRGGRLAILSALAFTALVSCGGGTTGLVGPTWQWTHLTENAPLAHTEGSDPHLYTLTLRDDGAFQARADCNTVSGTFVTDGDEITLSVGPSTLVACPEGSKADQFVDLLQTVDAFSVDGTDLALRLTDAAGTMGFTAEG